MKIEGGELTLLSKFSWKLEANPPTSPTSCSSGCSYPILDFPTSVEPVKIPKKVPKKELQLSSANENNEDEATVLLTQSQGTQQCTTSQSTPKPVTPLQKITKLAANTSCHLCGDSTCHRIRFGAFLVRYGNETRLMEAKKKSYLLAEKKRLSDDFKRTYHLLVQFDKFNPKDKDQGAYQYA